MVLRKATKREHGTLHDMLPQEDGTLHENLPIIEVADGTMLDALYADASVSHYILTRLSDRMAVVSPSELDALRDRLLELGQMPKIVGE